MKFNSNIFEPYKDQFNLYNLIKKINPAYKLYFNKKYRKFIIINSDKNNEVCKEFYSFSENILQDLRFSKIENSNNVFKFIDKHNQKLEQDITCKNKEIINTISSEYKTLSNRSNNITKSDLSKIIGATKC